MTRWVLRAENVTLRWSVARPNARRRKPQGKGVRAARTICQWQIVRPERTAHKRGAGGA